jgi:hypothetical protein
MTILRPDGSQAPGSPVSAHGIVVPSTVTVDSNDHVWVSDLSNPPTHVPK